MEKKHENKKLYLEIIRVIAIFLVIFNHSDAFKLPLQSDSCSLLNTAELLLSMCDKVAVPLFFMISGALLLAKEESIQTLYRKRVLRYVIVIILIQIIQHLYAHFAFGVTLSQRMFIHNCIMGWTAPLPKGTANLTIWFLYAYLAFLVLLPFLRVMVKHMKNELFIYLFILQIATCAFFTLQRNTVYKVSLSLQYCLFISLSWLFRRTQNSNSGLQQEVDSTFLHSRCSQSRYFSGHVPRWKARCLWCL